jgi:hypothetical protein
MRYREIAAPREPSTRERLSTVTLLSFHTNGNASTSDTPLDLPW